MIKIFNRFCTPENALVWAFSLFMQSMNLDSDIVTAVDFVLMEV